MFGIVFKELIKLEIEVILELLINLGMKINYLIINLKAFSFKFFKEFDKSVI